MTELGDLGIGVEIDLQSLEQQLKQLEEYQAKALTLQVQIDERTLKGQLKALKLDPIIVDVKLNQESLKRQLKQLNALKDDFGDYTIDVDTSNSERSLERLSLRLRAVKQHVVELKEELRGLDRSIKITTKIDDSEVRSSLQNLSGETTRTVRLKVKRDTSDAGGLDELKQEINPVVRPVVDTTQARKELDELENTVLEPEIRPYINPNSLEAQLSKLKPGEVRTNVKFEFEKYPKIKVQLDSSDARRELELSRYPKLTQRSVQSAIPGLDPYVEISRNPKLKFNVDSEEIRGAIDRAASSIVNAITSKSIVNAASEVINKGSSGASSVLGGIGEGFILETGGILADKVSQGIEKAFLAGSTNFFETFKNGAGLVGKAVSAVSSPFRNITRGFEEAIGAKFSDKFSKGFVENIESELQVSIEKIGATFGRRAVNTTANQSSRALGLDSPDEAKQLAQNAYGFFLDVGGEADITGAASKRYRENYAKSAEKAKERAKEIKVDELAPGTQGIILASGGYGGERGLASNRIAGITQEIVPDHAAIPIHNKSTEIKDNIFDGGLGTFLAQSITNSLNRVFVGHNPDAVEGAAHAIAYKNAYPDLKVGTLGYSAGGFVASETSEILKHAGIDSKAATLGTPFFGHNVQLGEDEHLNLFGELDPLRAYQLGSNRATAPTLTTGGATHLLPQYALDGDVQGKISQFFTGQSQTVDNPAATERIKALLPPTLPENYTSPRIVTSEQKEARFKLSADELRKGINSLGERQKRLTEELAAANIELDLSIEQIESEFQRSVNKANKKAGKSLQTRQLREAYLADKQASEAVAQQVAANPPPRQQLSNAAIQIAEPSSLQIDSNPQIQTTPLTSQKRSALLGTDAPAKEAFQAAIVQRKELFRTQLATVEQLTGKDKATALLKLLQELEREEDRINRDIAQKYGRSTSAVLANYRTFISSTGKNPGIKQGAEAELKALSPEARFATGQGLARQTKPGQNEVDLFSRGVNLKPKSVDDIDLARAATLPAGESIIGRVRGFFDSKLQQASEFAKSEKAGDLLTTAGVAAGKLAGAHLGGDLGLVGELAGGLGGSLVTRNAFALGQSGLSAFNGLKGSDKFEGAGLAGKLRLLSQQTGANFTSPATQRKLGAGLTTDLAGFAIGNLVNHGSGTLLDGFVGNSLLGHAPGKSAIASAVATPKVVAAREQHLDDLELARSGDQKQGLLSKVKAFFTSNASKQKLELDKTYELLIKEVASASGVALKPGDIPKLSVGDARLKELNASALYSVKENQILISHEVAALLGGTLRDLENGQAQIANVVHEARHATQLNFGRTQLSALSNGAAPGVELARTENASESARRGAAQSVAVARQQAGGSLPKNVERTISGLELDAYDFEKNTSRIVGNVSAELRRQQKPRPNIIRRVAGKTADLAGAGVNAVSEALDDGKLFNPIRLTKGTFAFAAGLGNTIAEARRNPSLKLDDLKDEESRSNVGRGVGLGRFLSSAARSADAELGANGAIKEKTFAAAAKIEGAQKPGQQFAQDIKGIASNVNLGDILKLKTKEDFTGYFQRLGGEAVRASQKFETSWLKASAQVRKGINIGDAVAQVPGLANLQKNLGFVKGAFNFGRQIDQPFLQLGATADRIFPGISGKLGELVKGFIAFQGLSILKSLFVDFGKASFEAFVQVDKLKTALDFASGGKGGASLKFVNSEVDRLKVPLQSSIQGFTQLAAATKGSAVSGAQTRSIFTGLSEASTVLSLSAEDTQGALLALSQTASKGIVSSEELRQQLGERIPGALGIAARSMGLTDEAFNKLLESGQILASDFLPKFGKQLHEEFGDAAAGAAGNAQSAIFNLQNAFLRLQIATGEAIAPTVITALNAVGVVTQFVADHIAGLVAIVLSLAQIFVGQILTALTQVFGVASILDLGILGLSASFGVLSKVVQQFGKQIVQAGLSYALVELVKAISSSINTDLVQSFNKAADAAEKAAKASRNIKLPPDPNDKGDKKDKKGKKPQTEDESPLVGLDYVFASELAFEDGGIQLRRQTGRKAPTYGDLQRSNLRGATNRELGGENQFLTDAQLRLDDLKTGKNPELKQYTDQLQTAQRERNALQATIARDFTRKGQAAPVELQQQLDAKNLEIKDITDKRNVVSKPFEGDITRVNQLITQQKSRIESLKEDPDTIAAVGGQTAADDEIAKREAALLQLKKFKFDAEGAIANLNINPILGMGDAFSKLAVAIESAERATKLFLSQQKDTILKTQLQTFGTDEDAGRTAALSSAIGDRQGAQQNLDATDKALKDGATVLDKPENEEALKGFGISKDSSIADIDKELKATGDDVANKGKRDLLEKLKAFKELQQKKADQQVSLDEADLKVNEQVQTNTLAVLDRDASKRDQKLKQDDDTRAIPLRKASADLVRDKANNKFFSDADAGLAEATLGIKSAQNQVKSVDQKEANTQQTLDELNGKKDQLSAEEFNKRQRELTTQLADLRVEKANAAAAVEEALAKKVEATNRKVIEGLELANQKASASIQLAETNQTAATKKRLLAAGLTDRNEKVSGIEQTGVDETATQQRNKLIQKEIADYKQLAANKRISGKELTEKLLGFNQELATNNEKLVDLQISRQKQLRDLFNLDVDRKVAADNRATGVIVRNLEKQKAAAEAVLKSLDISRKLAQSKGDLQQAISAYNQSIAQIGVDQSSKKLDLFNKAASEQDPEKQEGYQKILQKLGFNSSGDDASDKEKLIDAKATAEKNLADIKQRSLESEFALKQQLLELDLKRDKLQAEQAVREAKIAELSARKEATKAAGDLRKAIKEGDPEKIAEARDNLDSSQQAYELAKQNTGSAQEGLAATDQLAADSRAKLGVERDTALAQNDQERQNLGITQATDRVDAGLDPNKALQGDLFNGGSPFARIGGARNDDRGLRQDNSDSFALAARRDTSLAFPGNVSPSPDTSSGTVSASASTGDRLGTLFSSLESALTQRLDILIELTRQDMGNPRSVTLHSKDPVEDYAQYQNRQTGNALRSQPAY